MQRLGSDTRRQARTPSLLSKLLPPHQVIFLVLDNLEALLVERLLELMEVDVCCVKLRDQDQSRRESVHGASTDLPRL